MNEMIDRAALAVIQVLRPNACAISMADNGRIIVSPEVIEDAMEVVRAVVKELREPTPQMEEAAMAAAWAESARGVWHAMIDDLLK